MTKDVPLLWVLVLRRSLARGPGITGIRGSSKEKQLTILLISSFFFVRCKLLKNCAANHETKHNKIILAINKIYGLRFFFIPGCPGVGLLEVPRGNLIPCLGGGEGLKKQYREKYIFLQFLKMNPPFSVSAMKFVKKKTIPYRTSSSNNCFPSSHFSMF